MQGCNFLCTVLRARCPGCNLCRCRTLQLEAKYFEQSILFGYHPSGTFCISPLNPTINRWAIGATSLRDLGSWADEEGVRFFVLRTILYKIGCRYAPPFHFLFNSWRSCACGCYLRYPIYRSAIDIKAIRAFSFTLVTKPCFYCWEAGLPSGSVPIRGRSKMPGLQFVPVMGHSEAGSSIFGAMDFPKIKLLIFIF